MQVIDDEGLVCGWRTPPSMLTLNQVTVRRLHGEGGVFVPKSITNG
jgi:hypothetical protein